MTIQTKPLKQHFCAAVCSSTFRPIKMGVWFLVFSKSAFSSEQELQLHTFFDPGVMAWFMIIRVIVALKRTVVTVNDVLTARAKSPPE